VPPLRLFELLSCVLLPFSTFSGDWLHTMTFPSRDSNLS